MAVRGRCRRALSGTAIRAAPKSENAAAALASRGRLRSPGKPGRLNITDRLTVNIALHYEFEAAPSEAANQNVRGFDPAAAVSIEAAAKAA
jgi:hypothetical protein